MLGVALRRFARSLVLPLALAASAVAQTPPPVPQAPDPKAGAPAAAADPLGKELRDKSEALAREAQKLVEAYHMAIEGRVKKLAAENPTLKRLYDAGVFNMDGLTAGVPSEPLAALPEIRRVYEELEKTAQAYIEQKGGVAKEKQIAAAIEYMRKIVKAQEGFREEDKDGNGILDYAQYFYDLGQVGGLHVPPIGRRDLTIIVEGYRYRILSADSLHWSAEAVPTEGDVYLFADQTGTVRSEKGKPAGAKSAPAK